MQRSRRERRERASCTRSVPDAESFGLLDVEEWRFDLWFVVSLALSVRGGESLPVDVWVLLLKLFQFLASVLLTDVLICHQDL